MKIDLNCDLGEGMLYDKDIIPYITSANIACGYHAGSEEIMNHTIDLCIQNNVKIGAHPGFNDPENFGRIEVLLTVEEVYQLVKEQLEILDSLCQKKEVKLHHVKPHGALYNKAVKDKGWSAAIAQAVYDYNKDLILYGLSNSYMIEEAEKTGLKTANEVFADRTYQKDGSLTPRSLSNALIEDEAKTIQQVLMMIKEGKVLSTDQEYIPITAETLCLHGDGLHALQFAKKINAILTENGILIESI